MRTKTLLIAAAISVAGLVSSKADAVFSQNVVGYVNITVSNNAFAMIANQLDSGSNTLNNVLKTGPVSSDTTVLFWTGTQFQQFIYYNAGDSPDGNAGWYDVNTSLPTTNRLDINKGVFAHNSSGANITLTTVGQVLQGTNNFTIKSGFNIYSVPQPLGRPSLDSLGFPAVSGSDTYLQWTGSKYYQLIYYNAGDSPDGNVGWYDVNTSVLQSTNPAVWPKVGESFFINHGGADLVWTNHFTVQ